MDVEKIEAIKSYLSKNGVKFYDIQAELIDHFATAIEQQQRLNGTLTFTEALHHAHQNFGGKEGFRQFLAKAQKNVSIKTYRMVGQTLLSFLKPPYLLLTLSIGALWYMAFSFLSFRTDLVFGAITLLFLGVLLLNEIRLKKVAMYLPRKTTRALGWVLYLLVYIPGNHIWITGNVLSNTFGIIYFTFLTIALISFYQIPKLAIEETHKLYPQIA